jgi:ABC-2 type transport system permease protein
VLNNSLFMRGLRDRRLSLTIWIICLVLLALMMAVLFNSVKGFNMDQFLENMSESQRSFIKAFAGEDLDFANPAVYLHGRLFNLFAPLLLLILAISLGSDSLAGEEGRGTLDLLLSAPLHRRRAVLEKYASMCAALTIASLAFFLGLAAGALMIKMNINYLYMAETTLSMLILAIALGSLSMLVGAVSGNKGLAVGIAAGLAAASWLLSMLSDIIEWLKPWRRLSAFYYYIGNYPLKYGLNWLHVLVLAALTVVFLGASLYFFERRDLAV